jgi:prolyl 4-hydroxylase
MPSMLAPPPMPRLSPEWQDWLAGNVVRGCADAEMLEVMRGSGFDDHYARVAISVVRSMTERVQQQAREMLAAAAEPVVRADPIRLPAGARVQAADREVRIGFVLADPNVALVHDLLSEQECERLITMSSGKLTRSSVLDRRTGGDEVSAVRTSAGTFFERGENAIVARLEERISALTGLPVDHGEPLQVLHYKPGNEYLAHHDWFDPADPGSAEVLRNGGQRVVTLVIYLNDVGAGGETRFPEIGLDIRPQRGSAVYFEYLNAAGDLDPRCLHAGVPVTQGEKWIATKWIRQGTYRR